MRELDVVADGAGRALPFRVGGRTLWCSRRTWNRLCGPKPKDTLAFESDGCSRSPDTYRTLCRARFKLWPACFVHDYHYRHDVLLDPNAAGRRMADGVLRENIRRLVRMQGGGPLTAERIAWLYWGRVRIWGASSWRHWEEGRRPESWWRRLLEVWSSGV